MRMYNPHSTWHAHSHVLTLVENASICNQIYIMVRGYHVRISMWVNANEVLSCTREPGNCRDPHAVASYQKRHYHVGHHQHIK